MLNEDFLLDNFQVTGNQFETFEKAIEEITEATKFYKFNSSELAVLSYTNSTDDGRMIFLDFHPLSVPSAGGSSNLAEKRVKVNPEKILAKGKFENLIKELIDETGLFFWNGIVCMFVSKRVLTTRLQPFGLGGDFLADKSTERDLMIAKRFGLKAADKTLVIREINGIKKVFSMLGDKYRYMPQGVLIDIYKAISPDDLGKADCRYWEINHFYSGIKIEFPEKAAELQAVYGLPSKFVPGVYLATSDTGDCSVKIRATWRIGNACSLHQEVSHKHSGDVDVEEILDEVKEKIFAEYTRLPEALCDLMSKDITDPSWNLETTKGKSKNAKAVESALKTAFKELKVVAAIGKKAEISLFQQLLDEFDSSIAYTAYDIALAIMSLPARTSGLHSVMQEKLETAVGRAPYINYEGSKTTIPPVVLTA